MVSFPRLSVFKISEITKNAFLKPSLCASIIYSFGPPFYASLVLLQAIFFIITGKHPFEMQEVRKDLSLKISEIRKLFFRKTLIKDKYFDSA